VQGLIASVGLLKTLPLLTCGGRGRLFGAKSPGPAGCQPYETLGCLCHAGVLHVSAAQAGSCMQRFGDFDALPAPALSSTVDTVLLSAQDSTPQHLWTAFSPSKGHNPAQTAGGADEQVVNAAFCLATPPDNPAEDTESPMRPVSTRITTEDAPQVFRGTAGRLQARTTSSVLDSEAEELLQLEASAYQPVYMSAHAMCATEALQASASVRRQRRRVLLRLLRNGRDMTSSTLSVLQATPPAQLLASISISSMASWDDDTAAFDSCSS